jgi:hypothetical protein
MKTQTHLFIPFQHGPEAMRAAGAVLLAATLAVGGSAGCGKKTASSANPPPAKQDQTATHAPSPVMDSALTAWQQGDQSAAVSRFVETDWSAGPLFSPDSPLSLSEDQFKLLPAADRQAKFRDLIASTTELKRLAAAVAQAGRDAAAKKDLVQARKDFTSLKQCGEALDKPDSLALIKLVGQGFKKMAGTESAKLGQ